jgi:predicted RNA binding protein YcfA (HicA-like mRNA interferase family)
MQGEALLEIQEIRSEGKNGGDGGIVSGKSVKRKDLVRQLQAGGCVLVRHGGKHHWYRKSSTRVSQPIPGLNQRPASSLPIAS